MTFVTPLTSVLRRHESAIAWIGIGIGIVLTVVVLTTPWGMTDGLVYRDAGERLRNGESLFPATPPGFTRVYYYSPWFAVLWMLPIPDVVWIGTMTGCSIIAVIPGLRSGGWRRGLAAVIFPYLLLAAMGGNVHPAMIAALVYGVGTRAGPVAIAIAASLKGFPVLYTLYYVARREWAYAGVTLLMTAILVVPLLFVDLTHYPLSTEGSWSLYEWSPFLWAAVCIGLVVFVLARPSWLGASLLSMLARTKFVFYDVSYLLVGLDRRTDHRDDPTSPVAGSP